jgi:hypothetical protein
MNSHAGAWQRGNAGRIRRNHWLSIHNITFSRRHPAFFRLCRMAALDDPVLNQRSVKAPYPAYVTIFDHTKYVSF